MGPVDDEEDFRQDEISDVRVLCVFTTTGLSISPWITSRYNYSAGRGLLCPLTIGESHEAGCMEQ